MLERRQPARVIGVRFRVQERFDVLDVEAECRDARHDHRRGAGIAAVEHDVALRRGDEEGRDVVRADVVEIAGDAERFSGLLPAAVPLAFHVLKRNKARTVISPSRKTSTRRLVRCRPSPQRSMSIV
jgi:hypothetical protein